MTTSTGGKSVLFSTDWYVTIIYIWKPNKFTSLITVIALHDTVLRLQWIQYTHKCHSVFGVVTNIQILAYRIRFTFENGSTLALGAALDADSGAPNTFQNLSVSSAAADATVQPSGL